MRLALIIGGGLLLWMILRNRSTEQGGTDIFGFHVPETVETGAPRVDSLTDLFVSTTEYAEASRRVESIF